MTAVRKISVENDASHVPFTLEAAGLPERPIVTHQCPSCNSVAVMSAQEGREVAAWLIGECVDDANGNGVLYAMPDDMEDCQEPTCRRYGEMVMKPHTHTPPGEPIPATCATRGCAMFGKPVDMKVHQHYRPRVTEGRPAGS